MVFTSGASCCLLDVMRIVVAGDTVGCSYLCDAYELYDSQNIIARYIGGVLNGILAIVECKIGKGRVIVMGTKPDDSWLSNFVKKLTNEKSYSSDSGVFVIEQADNENKSAGIITINTNQQKSKYAYNGVSHILESHGVAIYPSHKRKS